MGARYVHITKEEFTEFAKSKRFYEVDEPKANEVVYERISKNGQARLRIFSTISTMGGDGRKVGSDAIRLVLQVYNLTEDRWQGTGWKAKRVHRTKNWRINLTKRMHDAATIIHNELCPKCGHSMIKRESEFGTFYSCSAWRATGCNGKRSS